MGKLTDARLYMLRHLNGELVPPGLLPRAGKARQTVIRSLIERGLIYADGWALTTAGREALKREKGND